LGELRRAARDKEGKKDRQKDNSSHRIGPSLTISTGH
jgi:hypothetical protein